MRVCIRDGRLRLPLVNADPNLIDTGFISARFFRHSDPKLYVGELAVHPSLNYPNAGIWTVACAKSGVGVMHLPSQEEAECFALELLREFGEKGTRLDFGPSPADCPPETARAITFFKCQWGERRKLALPAHAAKTQMPSGIVLPTLPESGT